MKNHNPILIENDLVSTAHNCADALACLDVEKIGDRYGASDGHFLLLETIAAALNAAAPRDRSDVEAGQ